MMFSAHSRGLAKIRFAILIIIINLKPRRLRGTIALSISINMIETFCVEQKSKATCDIHP